MRRWLQSLVKPHEDRAIAHAWIELQPEEREAVDQMMLIEHGLPHPDWSRVHGWIWTLEPTIQGQQRRASAVHLRWLEQLRAALNTPHEVWQVRQIDGITPAPASMGQRVVDACIKTLGILEKDFAPIRGAQPIPDFALIGLAETSQFISFYAHQNDDAGHEATPGAFYCRAHEGAPPMIVLNLSRPDYLESPIAHELTHHALQECNLPLWIEEGLTQWMEERVFGNVHTALDLDRARQHRQRWEGDGLREFLTSRLFFSPTGEDQSLSYELALWIARQAMADLPIVYMNFLRLCKEHDPDEACMSSMGCTTKDFARRMIGLTDRS